MQRPDPLSTKKLCIITLTRMFLLTHEYQALVREITTPSLAGFTTACLNLAQGPGIQDSLLVVILQSLSELIILHPTSFRPFVPQLQKLALLLAAPTPSDLGSGAATSPISTPVTDNARRLFVLLHVCGPRNTAGEEWARSLKTVLAATHRTADRVFRALIEDWRPSAENHAMQTIPASEVVSDQKPEPLALPSWTGIYAGIERLDGLLRTVQAFLATTTSAAVVLPVTNIMHLVDRILSALQPSSTRNSRIRPEIGRDEREGLGVGLPQLHVSAMGILSLMVSRIGGGFAALSNTALEQVLWILENEWEIEDVRVIAYRLVSQILSTFGPSLPKSSAVSLSRCVTLACADLLPQDKYSSQDGQAFASRSKNASGINATSTNADSYLDSVETQAKISHAQPPILAAARELLPIVFTKLPKGFLSVAVRSQIDRTAILTNHKEAMLASVMNTATSKKGRKSATCVLPLLARGYPEALEVETLLRPQMPLVQSRQNQEGMTMSDEVEELSAHEDRPKDIQNGFHRNGFGFSGNRNGQSDHIESKDGILQSSTTSDGDKATIAEPPLVAQNTQTGLAEPKFTVSYTSSKHDREEDFNSTIQTGGSDVATLGSAGPTETGAPSKRARLTMDQPLRGHESVSAIDVQVLGAVVPQSSISEAVGATGAQFDVEKESDESDFEMPTLYLEPDTDAEDDEDDDNDEDDD